MKPPSAKIRIDWTHKNPEIIKIKGGEALAILLGPEAKTVYLNYVTWAKEYNITRELYGDYTGFQVLQGSIRIQRSSVGIATCVIPGWSCPTCHTTYTVYDDYLNCKNQPDPGKSKFKKGDLLLGSRGATHLVTKVELNSDHIWLVKAYSERSYTPHWMAQMNLKKIGQWTSTAREFNRVIGKRK